MREVSADVASFLSMHSAWERPQDAANIQGVVQEAWQGLRVHISSKLLGGILLQVHTHHIHSLFLRTSFGTRGLLVSVYLFLLLGHNENWDRVSGQHPVKCPMVKEALKLLPCQMNDVLFSCSASLSECCLWVRNSSGSRGLLCYIVYMGF